MASQLNLPPERMQQLQAKYPNKYVAMCEGKVVAAGDNMAEVMAKGERAAKGRKCLVRFIPRGDLLVLKFSNPA